MLRALIAAVLIAAAANAVFDTPLETALGYSIVGSVLIWFLTPALRLVARLLRRVFRGRRSRRRPASTHRAPRTITAATPSLTQINHHHHYYPQAAPAQAHWTDPDLLGLPQHSQRKAAHDAIYNTIDIDEA